MSHTGLWADSVTEREKEVRKPAYANNATVLLLKLLCGGNKPAAAECSSGHFHPAATSPPSPSDWLEAECAGSTESEIVSESVK